MAITDVDTTSYPENHYSRRSFLAGVIACGTISAAASYLISGRPAGTVELRMASGDDENGARKAVIDAFNAQSDSAKITLVELPSETFDQKRTMRDWAEAGQVDLVNLDVIHIPEFARAGLIEPISLPNTSDFLAKTLRLAGDAGGGRYWAAPFNADVGMLFRQQPIQDPVTAGALKLGDVVAGSVTEQSPQSRFLRFAGQLQPRHSAADEAFVVNVLEHALSPDKVVLSENGEVSLDVDVWRTRLEPLRKAIQEGRVLSCSTEEETQKLFSEGRLGYMRNWPVRYRYLQENNGIERGDLRIALYPMERGILGGQSLAVVKRSRYVEQAQEAVRYLTGTSSQTTLATYGLAPTRVTAYTNPNLSVLMPYLDAVRGAVENGHPRPMHHNYAAFSQAVRRHVHPFVYEKAGKLEPRFTDELTNALR